MNEFTHSFKSILRNCVTATGLALIILNSSARGVPILEKRKLNSEGLTSDTYYRYTTGHILCQELNMPNERFSL